MRLSIAVLVGLLTVGCPAAADNSSWEWLWVVPSPDPSKGWTTFTGHANVAFDGHSLNATLESHGEWDPRLQIRGQIVGRNVTITLTEMGTDAVPTRYSGTYFPVRTRLTDPSNGWGEDRIVAQSGTSYLSLRRTVQSSN